MDLLDDTFYVEAQARLWSTGWRITAVGRYDPTHVVGITPNGKAFTADLVGGTVAVKIAGLTGTINRARDLWERGDLAVTAILDAWSTLPANQR